MNKFFYLFRRFKWVFYWFTSKDLSPFSAPIFLIGNQGDGITFISRILRRSSKVYSVTGDNTYWTGADEMATVMELLLSKNLRLAGRILKTDPFHKQFSQPRSWSYGSNDLINDYHLTEQDVLQEDRRTLIKALSISKQRFGMRSGKRFLDKSQVFTVKTRFVQEILKDSNPYFVLFTRDPFVSCYRAAAGRAGDLKRYSEFMTFDERFDVACEHWKNCMHTIIDDSKHLKNFKWFKFEDFINYTEENVRSLCEFLGIDFNHNMLPGPNQKIPFGTKYRFRWYPIKKNVNAKYLENIDPKYFDQVEERMGDLAAYFGYHHPLKDLK